MSLTPDMAWAALDLALDAAGWMCLVLGGFFCLVGAIGLNRMPDVFTRMHATSVSDTLGVGFLVIGMLTQTSDWTVIVRLVIIVLVLYVTGAVASHALARAALHDGNKPVLDRGGPDLEPTECSDLYPELGVRLATPLMSEQVEKSIVPEAVEQEGAPSNS